MSTASAQSSDRTQTVFEGARVIVGDRTVIDNAAFLVENDRFVQVARVGQVRAAGARHVDLTGKTVIPALLDMHSHPGYENSTLGTEKKDNYTRENLIDHLERFAFTGTALTQSLGSDPPYDFVWQMRDQSQARSFPGARFVTVGRGLAWPGTGPEGATRNDTPYPVVSVYQAKLAVQELAAHHVSFVKLWVEDRGGYQVPANRPERANMEQQHGIPEDGQPSMLTATLYQAAIEEAHKLGLRTLAHVKTREELKKMLRAGIDGWTHPIGDLRVDSELLKLLKERPQLWYIPVLTSSLSGGSAPREPGQRPSWFSDPLLKAIKCPSYLENWAESFERNRRVSPPTGGLGAENARELYQAGVRFAFGSHDVGENRIIGWGSHMELEAYVNWVGMTPLEAIAAATSAGAEMLQRSDVGLVAAGRSADFIVLDANPLEDIRNTRRISDVYLRGQRLDRPAMAARWAAECQAAADTK